MSTDKAPKYDGKKLTRHNFPKDFVFGAATSAYQVEGAYQQDGRSLSNWDTFTLQRPDQISDGSNGGIAIDHYNRMKEDVALMKKLGLDSYRFSIAWSRILPAGRLSGGINRQGVKFYNDLIDMLLSQGIEPFVTLFHFDIPQCLQDEYGGFSGPKILQDFADFAEVCFFEFGDRVKYWVTENEPYSFVNQNITMTSTANVPTAADAEAKPYIVAHNLLRAHAIAVDIYRRKYQAVQGGKIGVTNVTTWYEPYTQSKQDIDAASRALDFMWGWFVAPIVTGDYPLVMRQRVGDRLPEFSVEEKMLLKGSYDFIGVNYYTTNWAADKPNPPDTRPTYETDAGVEFFTERNGIPIGEQAASDWLFIVPYGIKKLLEHVKNTYNDPIIYVTENGLDEKNDKSLTITQALKDDHRINFYQDHFAYAKEAMDNGVKLKGYFLWALFDNFEWTEGYTARFGLYYVDFANGLGRYPKHSAIWFMNFLNKNILPHPKRQVEEDESETKKKKKRNRSSRFHLNHA